MKLVKNVKDLKVGETYRYQGIGTMYKNAVYTAVVLGIYAHIILMSICIDETSMEEPVYGNPIPYNWAICKNDIGRTERLYEI